MFGVREVKYCGGYVPAPWPAGEGPAHLVAAYPSPCASSEGGSPPTSTAREQPACGPSPSAS